METASLAKGEAKPLSPHAFYPYNAFNKKQNFDAQIPNVRICQGFGAALNLRNVNKCQHFVGAIEYTPSK